MESVEPQCDENARGSIYALFDSSSLRPQYKTAYPSSFGKKIGCLEVMMEDVKRRDWLRLVGQLSQLLEFL